MFYYGLVLFLCTQSGNSTCRAVRVLKREVLCNYKRLATQSPGKTDRPYMILHRHSINTVSQIPPHYISE